MPTNTACEMGQSGVYYITNLINRKMYVGSALDIRKRWRYHISCLNRNCHENEHLQRAWYKYSKKSFYFGILELCNPEDLVEREQFLIDGFDTYKSGYNRRPVAESQLGKRHSEETIEKMRKVHTGMFHSEESKKKMSIVQKGIRPSTETKERMSIAAKKRASSEELSLRRSMKEWKKIKKDITMNEVRYLAEVMLKGEISL